MWKHNRPTTYYSVLGAYAYDDTIFDNFYLHSDIDIDMDSLKDYLIYENADLPLNVVNLELLKIKIGLWAKKQSENWLRMYRALYQEYNPLHNFDKFEETSDNIADTGSRSVSEIETTGYTSNTSERVDDDLTHNGEKEETVINTPNLSDATTYGKTETRTDNLTDNTSTSHGETQTHTGTETNTHENTAFNQGLSATAKDTISKNLTDVTDFDGSESTSHTGTQNNTLGGTDTLRKTGTDTTNTQGTDSYTDNRDITKTGSQTDSGSLTGAQSEETEGNRDVTHDGHLWGNIGVTTSQKMLEDEILVRWKYNFFDIISEQFRQEFCILVYC